MLLQKQIAGWIRQYGPAEQGRLMLWFPVWFAAGILAYFSLEEEPSALSIFFWPAIVGLALFSLFRRRRYAYVWLALAIAFSGFAWGKLYTDSRDVRMLREQTRITDVRGEVRRIEQTAKGWRLTLERVSVDKLDTSESPSAVRLNIRGKQRPDAQRGDEVKLRAGLLPPSGPVMDGGFDFARFFFFRGIGAVGYGLPPVDLLERSPRYDTETQLQEARNAISDRLIEQLGPREGAVAAALMIGDRAALPKDITESMRITNLSHILAISGMHMALVTGIVFFAVRYALVLMPSMALHPHNKKYAAAAGLFAGLSYLVLADFPISAVRAYVMVALLLGAVLLDREVQPMRSLAWAALLLLLYNPANVLEPGFQLSFVATMGLIAWYEAMRARQQDEEEHKSFFRKLRLYLGAIMLTTLVAELVTAPLVIYHFNNASFYGMLANLMVMPIVAFVIMPFIVLSYLFWATPLAPYLLEIVGYGIEVMLIISGWVADLPHAEQFLPAPSGWSIALSTLGLVWLCVMQARWRYAGVPIALFAMLPLFWQSAPDYFISHDRAQIAIRIDGELQMVKGRGTSFAPRQWANGVGETVFPSFKGEKNCDSVGCIYDTQAGAVGVYEDYKIVPEGYCPDIDVLFATFYWNGACKPAHFIDRNDIEDHGTHWGWYDGRVGTTDELDGTRPWSRYRSSGR